KFAHGSCRWPLTSGWDLWGIGFVRLGACCSLGRNDRFLCLLRLRVVEPDPPRQTVRIWELCNQISTRSLQVTTAIDHIAQGRRRKTAKGLERPVQGGLVRLLIEPGEYVYEQALAGGHIAGDEGTHRSAGDLFNQLVFFQELHDGCASSAAR